MVEREVMTRPRRRSTSTVDATTFAAPSWGAAPEPSADSGVSRAPTSGFDFSSIAIYPPEPQIGPAHGAVGPAIADRIRAKQGGGAPLAFPTQQRMEGAFGHTFADVRIHADGESDLLNRGVGASAFTLGSDIFLSDQATGVGAHGGDGLLTHELTHVVQQRGTAPSGPLTVDPVDAPGEREASAVAQAVSAGNAVPAQMQAATQNHGVLQRVAAAPVASAAPAEPADVAAQSAFNPMDINHKLLRAIDQEHVKVVGMQVPESGFGFQQPIYKRHVDFDETVAALNHLTAAQVQEVKSAYLAHEGRTLEHDLFDTGESGYPSDLTEDQSYQIRALLGGTVAGPSASAQEQQDVAMHAGVAAAAELHRLLHGNLETEDIERVMGLLRHDAKTNNDIIAAYTRIGGDLHGDVYRMGPLESARATKLLAGDVTGADALKVTFDKTRIIGIDERIAKLTEDSKDDNHPFEAMNALIEIKSLQKERKEHIEDIEKRAEQAGAEARAGAQGDATAAVQDRMKAVLGDPNATANLVGGADAAVIRGMASDDPVAKVAAQLRKASADGKLDAEQLTAALRSLRTEAHERAQRSLPKGDPRIEETEKRLADDYYTRIGDAYNALVGGDDKKFDELVKDTGDEGDTAVNTALVQGRGKLDDVTELKMALSGTRKDTATVERVLRDKSAKEIAQLRAEYRESTHGRSLDFDLFGNGPTTAGDKTENMMGREIRVKDGTLEEVTQGKASGTSRLNLEDYMKRPDTEGGPKEVAYILARAEREYQYTIDNRGATGAIRDTFGNEERDLLDETIKEVRKLVGEYCSLVGWVMVFDPEAEDIERPQMVQSQQAQALIVQMRMARATIRGDRAAYEKATAALRAIFEMVAAFVIQAALTALLSPAAAALLEAVELGADAVEAGVMAARIAKFAANTTVNVASTIGSNLAVHGSDYSLEMLRADMLGGLGGSIGGEAVEKMLGPVAKGMAERLGPKCSTEIIALAKTAGSIEGGAWAQGSAGDLSLQNIVKTHLMGKAAGAITEATSSAAGLTPEPGPQKGAAPEAHATPQTTEPTPQESHPGGTGSDEPRRTPPVSAGQDAAMGSGAGPIPGSREPTTPERLPSSPLDEEPSQTSSHGTTEATTTDDGRPGGRSPSDEEKTLVDVKPIDEEQTRVDWEPEVVRELPDGSAMWFDTPAETRAEYNRSIREDSRREVAIYRNTRTGETVIVQGDETSFKVDLQVAHEALPGPDGTWELEAHYHPINPQTGVTRVPQRLPTSTNGDFAILEWESQRAGNQPRTSRIDYVVEGDKRDYTEYSYDPSAEHPYKINYPDPVNGKRVPVDFKSREAYEEWFSDNFPDYRADIERPSAPTGPVPAGSAPGADEGGTGGPRGEEPDRTTTSAEQPGMRSPEDTQTPGDFDPFDEESTRVEPAPAEFATLSQLREEIRRLVQGEGIVLPGPGGGIERSDREVDLARQTLRNPEATPEDQRAAIRVLAECAVAEYRASHMALEGEPGEPLKLTAEDLRSMCMAGRDVTAEAIIALVGISPHPVRMERVQAAHLGFKSRHAFTVVTLADGTKFLVDPTFAQFADEAGGTSYTAESMLSGVEGGTLARDLLRDGVVPLTGDTALQYVIGLGADPAAANAAAERLISGDAAILTEIVRNGQVQRTSARPQEAYQHMATVSDPITSPLKMLQTALTRMPTDHPLRPLLESLVTDLEVLAKDLPRLPEPPPRAL